VAALRRCCLAPVCRRRRPRVRSAGAAEAWYVSRTGWLVLKLTGCQEQLSVVDIPTIKPLRWPRFSCSSEPHKAARELL
jgi:hypothetical protein